MNSDNPLGFFLHDLLRGSGVPSSSVVNVRADGAVPASMMHSMRPPFILGSLSDANVAPEMRQRAGGSASPGLQSATSASPGHVYAGDVPPMLWIEREQRRVPLPIFAAGGPNMEGAVLREEGNDAFKAGRYSQAVHFYSLAIEADPQSEFNYTNRSFAYYHMKEYEKSAADAAKAVQINASFFKGHYRLGMAEMGLGHFARAIGSLRTALQLAPEPHRQSIQVSIAKCESKLARAPATPLLMGPCSLTPTSNGAGARSPWPASSLASANAGADASSPAHSTGAELRSLGGEVERVAALRDRAAEYTERHTTQESIVECGRRSETIKSLMGVATSSELSRLSKEVEEKQSHLRRVIAQQDVSAYHQALRDRDATVRKLWEVAGTTGKTIAQLQKIAKEEQSFFSQFGPAADSSSKAPTEPSMSAAVTPKAPHIAADVHHAVAPIHLPQPEPSGPAGPAGPAGDLAAAATPQPSSPSAQATATAAPSTPRAGSTASDAELGNLLRRRNTIYGAVRKAQKCYSATDAAGQALARALKAEGDAMEEVRGLLVEAEDLGAQLEAHARLVAQTATKELSEGRLQALEQMRSTVERVKADEEAFARAVREGDSLLGEEAKLEQQRLLLEHQRIQVQAEVEWLKVRDEPESRIAHLQQQVKRLQLHIATIHDTQKTVQTRIMELVNGDHPELAWKSVASGSRILRLVKGSGLWQNLSFSDFQVVSTLSSTANSKVYHAVRRGEHVAVKEIAIDDEEARRRFQREVNIISGCNHPNIVRIKGVFFDGPFAYILLPYYHRGSLRTLLTRQEPMSWVAMQDLLRQLVSGVVYLHERGIVHADLKPSNVLIADDGRPVVADFGIAKDHGALGVADVTMTSTTTITTTGGGASVSGTRQYMSPEQLLPESGSRKAKSTGMSDVWALGITMLEAALHNAYFHEPSLGKPAIPPLLPESQRIEVTARSVGGDEKLADMIASALVADPTKRATAYDVLAHPYFGASLRSVHSGERSSALESSDKRIDAVRAYLHTVRSSSQQKVLVSVSRNHMVQSVSDIFQHLHGGNVLAPIHVVFQGESGIDEGALTTEMLNIFYEQMIVRKKVLVCAGVKDADADADTVDMPTSQPVGAGEGAAAATVAAPPNALGARSPLYSTIPYLPAPDADGIARDLFVLLGKVLLKTMIENRQLPLQLSSAVLKFLCGAEPSFVDLEEYDAVLANTLKRLRLLSAADLADAGLDFSHFTAEFLKARSEDRYQTDSPLTPQSVNDYIDLRVSFDLIERRRLALEAVKEGFYFEPSFRPHLKLLSASDLQLLLCGQMHVAAQAIVDALEFYGFSQTSNTPKYLKEVLLEMPQNNLRRFLQLCTATASVPTGSAVKKIKVMRGADLSRLPVGHSCTSQLDLPDYDDKQAVKEKIEISLAHVSDGFHIA
ncbi:MAP kinase kinase-like protein [Novymonas esmeraldas]|uniref:non-specific serine/threonine protein kinase n=1 Tax=Novymonas esmeraldas TaxID=1808958 RepID=A0AAW0F5X2_9TRYP